MTELSPELLAQRVASEAKKLSHLADALARLADEPGPARVAVERINDSARTLSWLVGEISKVAAK